MGNVIPAGCSSLATCYILARDNYDRRKYWSGPIDTITIHCTVGQGNAEHFCKYFEKPRRTVSSNYVVGNDGSIGISVPEPRRSACTSDGLNDARGVTIEVSSDDYYPYEVTNEAYSALLNLVTDICVRNGIPKLVWSTNASDRVNHRNGCNMTVHRDYTSKECPGDYLYNLHGAIAAEVNRRLTSGEYILYTTAAPGGTGFAPIDISNSITAVAHGELSLTELADISFEVLFKLISNTDADLPDYTLKYNLYKKIKNTDGTISEDAVTTDKKFSISKGCATLTVDNLLPDTTYAIEVLAKLPENSDYFSMTPKMQIKTKQSYPKNVSSINLKSETGLFTADQLEVQFSPTTDWGYWDTSDSTQKGYRISLIIDGAVSVYKDISVSDLSDVTPYSVEINDLLTGTDIKIEQYTNIQIGVQPWISLSKGKVIDEADLNSSNSMFIRIKPKIDKIYVKPEDKHKRAIIYSAAKGSEFFE